MKPGDRVRLWVKSVDPLSFQLVADGKKDFNYEANLDWSALMKSLNIPHTFKIAGDAPHSATACFEQLGDAVMLFHAENFLRAGIAR